MIRKTRKTMLEGLLIITFLLILSFGSIASQQQSLPLIGDPFPQMQVRTTQGTINLPDDYSGQWFILFSHPGDFTPVCTTEFVSFAKLYPKFQELNCALIGLSIDQVYAHMKWVEWIEENLDTPIPFPVIADNTGEVAQQLGMIHPGRSVNTVRAVFIIDEQGIIRIILYYPPEIGRSMDEILRALEALQVSDKYSVAIPANWPENELIGDRVIIPPPGSIKEAQTRQSEYDCFDWWLCHKALEE